MTADRPRLALPGALLAAVASVGAGAGGAQVPSDAELRALPGLPAPLTDADFRRPDPARTELGRLLFFDPLLSGNRNIACGTCHHPDLASADAVSLGVGEGGEGLGTERAVGPDGVKHRVPRHAPALFNLGATEFGVLFHDGRVSVDPDSRSGFDTPAEEFLPEGLQSVVAAQAIFPLLAEVEMAGGVDETRWPAPGGGAPTTVGARSVPGCARCRATRRPTSPRSRTRPASRISTSSTSATRSTTS